MFNVPAVLLAVLSMLTGCKKDNISSIGSEVAYQVEATNSGLLMVSYSNENDEAISMSVQPASLWRISTAAI